jgi:hypothetical protein
MGPFFMEHRIERALELLREAGACFPDSFEALRGAKVVADALDREKKEALREAEETSLVPEVAHHHAHTH